MWLILRLVIFLWATRAVGSLVGAGGSSSEEGIDQCCAGSFPGEVAGSSGIRGGSLGKAIGSSGVRGGSLGKGSFGVRGFGKAIGSSLGEGTGSSLGKGSCVSIVEAGRSLVLRSFSGLRFWLALGSIAEDTYG
jgi:hypothetical protein